MLEEIGLWLQESPDAWLPLGIVGILCLLVAIVPLVRPLRRRIGQWFHEIPLIKRIGQWFQENPQTIPLGIGVLCLLGAVALLANPVRLLMHGKNADGVVTAVVESTSRDETGKTTIRSTATIRFKAGDRNMEIQRSTSRESGSTCIAGCYSKGERLKMLYLADDPEIAEVKSFVGLFGGPLVLGLIGAMAIFFWRLWRSERSASKA